MNELGAALVGFMLVLLGYTTGRIHSWFLELIWRDSAGKRLRAVAKMGQTDVTTQAIADVLEMSSEAPRG